MLLRLCSYLPQDLALIHLLVLLSAGYSQMLFSRTIVLECRRAVFPRLPFSGISSYKMADKSGCYSIAPVSIQATLQNYFGSRAPCRNTWDLPFDCQISFFFFKFFFRWWDDLESIALLSTTYTWLYISVLSQSSPVLRKLNSWSWLVCLARSRPRLGGSGILEYGVEISDFWIPRFLWTLSMQKLSTLLLS